MGGGLPLIFGWLCNINSRVTQSKQTKEYSRGSGANVKIHFNMAGECRLSKHGN